MYKIINNGKVKIVLSIQVMVYLLRFPFAYRENPV